MIVRAGSTVATKLQFKRHFSTMRLLHCVPLELLPCLPWFCKEEVNEYGLGKCHMKLNVKSLWNTLLPTVACAVHARWRKPVWESCNLCPLERLLPFVLNLSVYIFHSNSFAVNKPPLPKKGSFFTVVECLPKKSTKVKGRDVESNVEIWYLDLHE